jgi:hypothetical protein
MMKVTEKTTLGELAAYLAVLGSPFVTMMKASPGADHARHAIVHLPSLGSFNGSGATEAEALEAAFTALRLELLPEPLKAFARPIAGEPITVEQLATVCGAVDAADAAATDARHARRLLLLIWVMGVRDAIDKLWAAKASGVELTHDKIFELLNILLQHPPEPIR